jgi:hypothetical protein
MSFYHGEVEARRRQFSVLPERAEKSVEEGEVA